MKYLKNINESLKTFDFQIDKYYNHKTKYKKNLYYFTTDNGFKYVVSIGDVLKPGKYFGRNIIEFSFRIINTDPNNSTKILINNPSEIFKTMNTIFKCIKNFTNTYYVEYICYTPTISKNKKNSDNIRSKIYNHYFKKFYPNCKIEKINKEYFVELI
jgi:hypothetical protein